MFGWQLHIKAKCKVKLAYTAVFIMLPLPAQTFFPFNPLAQLGLDNLPTQTFTLSLYSILLSCLSPGAVQRETKTSVNWITLFSDPSTFRLSLLSLASAAAVCVLNTHASERFSKVLLDSANLTKGGSRFITVLLLTDGWENEVTSLVLRGARAINWKAHITRCSGWPSAPIWFL